MPAAFGIRFATLATLLSSKNFSPFVKLLTKGVAARAPNKPSAPLLVNLGPLPSA